MARKKHFLDGLAYRRTKINPDDVVYRKGTERPADEEVIKEVERNEFKYNKPVIFISGAIILAVVSKVLGVELPLPILLGLGAVLGVALFFLDKWIARYFKDKSEKSKDEQKQ